MQLGSSCSIESASCNLKCPKEITPDQIPAIQSFDKIIHAYNGTTSALELRTEAMQAAKHIRRPASEQRMVDLVRLISALQRELRFFRAEYEASQALVEGLHSVSHQMYLNYFTYDGDGQLHQEWFNQAQEIDRYLQRYHEVIRKAEADWIELSRHQAERDQSAWV
ncbi:uncharacterized protein PV07_10520 [Cladophialophora immunda]|uniref:Uncharacterized protein n=1 Tax=Cladophialophora immunda TaxID=569365 RepID=A0A0D2C2W1_9EURO|nr:uncharacterized protein PV07_10520 [Cladophialophora immunda]KIW24830.1 hypothetical protein PV07_10520 [Cladophialophora immunda]